MKILFLMSSLRLKGNTDMAIERIKATLIADAEAAKYPLEIETLNLGYAQIAPCRGCRVCFDRGEEFCPIKDDIPEIKAKMKDADAIVVASPVYVDDINGVMKNWIDRLAHVCHRPEFGGKSAYLLVTVGSSRTGHALRTLDTALRTWGYHIIGKSGFKTHAKMSREQIDSNYGRKLDEIAKRIMSGLKRQEYKNPSFISLMIFRIQQVSWSQADPDTVDYQYWRKQGWLDKGGEFLIPPASNRIKVVAARLTGTIVAKIMS